MGRDRFWYSNSDPSNFRILKISEMDDTHLANVFVWVKERKEQYRNDLVQDLENEIELRKLPQEFLNLAPFPKEQWGKSVNEILKLNKRPSRLQILGIVDA